MTFGIDRDDDPRRAQLARRLAAMAERGSEWRARREAPAATTDGELEAIWGAASLLHQVEEHALDFGAAVVAERVYTPWSHARAMLELSARAWWLVEPDIGAEATLQRTIAVRIDTWGKMHKAYRAMGFDTVNSIADQLRSERVKAVEVGAPQGIPTATDLTHRMMPDWDAEGDGEIVGGPYRQLSAMAHGTSYAVLMVGDIDRDGDAPRGASRLRAALSVERAAEIVTPAMIAYEMSVGAWLSTVRAEVPMWTEAVSQACELVDELRPT